MFKRLTLLWTVLRGDARQLWFALRHPLAPAWLKLGAALPPEIAQAAAARRAR